LPAATVIATLLMAAIPTMTFYAVMDGMGRTPRHVAVSLPSRIERAVLEHRMAKRDRQRIAVRREV
jgi:hypothetical protein